VARGKHKGALPTPVAKLFYFPLSTGPCLLSSATTNSGTHSAGMALEKSRGEDKEEDSSGKNKPRSKSVVNTLISSGRRRGDSGQDLLEKEKLEKDRLANESEKCGVLLAGNGGHLERRVAELEKENEELKQQIVELKKSLSRNELK